MQYCGEHMFNCLLSARSLPGDAHVDENLKQNNSIYLALTELNLVPAGKWVVGCSHDKSHMPN